MDKGSFLNKLRKSLNKLPEDEVDEIIEDYSMHIDELLEEGEDLDSILLTLGSPSKIAKEYINELGYEEKSDSKTGESKKVELLKENYSEKNFNENKHHNKSESNKESNLILFVGLQFLNALFLAGFLIGLISACGGLIIAGGSIVLSTIPVMIFVPGIGIKIFTILMLIGLGILLLNGGLAGGTALIKLTIKYAKWNISLIK